MRSHNYNYHSYGKVIKKVTSRIGIIETNEYYCIDYTNTNPVTTAISL